MMRVLELPGQLNLSLVNLPDWAFLEPKDRIDKAEALFGEFIPANTKIIIEDNSAYIGPDYIFRLQYTSARSGRTMCMVAKGDKLPEEVGELLSFYLRQLVLTPSEVAREFSRVYFLERRTRQQAFIDSNYQDSRRIAIVASLDEDKDSLSFEEYA